MGGGGEGRTVHIVSTIVLPNRANKLIYVLGGRQSMTTEFAVESAKYGGVLFWPPPSTSISLSLLSFGCNGLANIIWSTGMLLCWVGVLGSCLWFKKRMKCLLSLAPSVSPIKSPPYFFFFFFFGTRRFFPLKRSETRRIYTYIHTDVISYLYPIKSSPLRPSLERTTQSLSTEDLSMFACNLIDRSSTFFFFFPVSINSHLL